MSTATCAIQILLELDVIEHYPIIQKIHRPFVEVRQPIRPMVCLVNVASIYHILYSIFQKFNLEWKIRTFSLFTQAV
jgi:hypothetical protein